MITERNGLDNATVLSSDRLILSQLSAKTDAAFILELVNDPAWIEYIGDKNVHDLDAACTYLRNGPEAMYLRHGFGLYRIALKDSGVPIGICGLIKRETLDDVDLGFAILPAFRGNGYAREAAEATLAYGQRTFGFNRVVAITVPSNTRSIVVLENIGFRFERNLDPTPSVPEIKLFAWHSVN